MMPIGRKIRTRHRGLATTPERRLCSLRRVGTHGTPAAMNVSDLTLEDFARNVASDGVTIRFGPFVSRIVTTLPELAAPIKILYDDFPLATQGLIDYRVTIRSSFSWRQFSSPQAEFVVDSSAAFHPFDRPFALAFLEWGLNRCIYTRQ